jgi:hypothetical protein
MLGEQCTCTSCIQACGRSGRRPDATPLLLAVTAWLLDHVILIVSLGMWLVGCATGEMARCAAQLSLALEKGPGSHRVWPFLAVLMGVSYGYPHAALNRVSVPTAGMMPPPGMMMRPPFGGPGMPGGPGGPPNFGLGVWGDVPSVWGSPGGKVGGGGVHGGAEGWLEGDAVSFIAVQAG